MDFLTSTWPLEAAVLAGAVAAIVIAVFGVQLSQIVYRLSDCTGIGQALAGGLLLAAATSLAGLTTSIVAAVAGNASLAVSNSIGGIAAQTAFIVVADLAFRGANLEHAAPSLSNLLTTVMMLVLLAMIAAAAAGPAVSIGGIHPVTPLLVLTYLYGTRLSRHVGRKPLWSARDTAYTQEERPPDHGGDDSARTLWLKFAGLALIVTAAGFVLARSGLAIIAATGLGGTVVGVLFTGVATSLPELVTTVAAVRAGAPIMAIGGIVGGNAFDSLFVAFSDVAYRNGSIYEHLGQADRFVLAWASVLVGVLAAGLLRRESHTIGFEGWAILALYILGIFAIAFGGL